MLCVCTEKVGVKNTELVCKAVRLAFSCQTSAISYPFIPIPWFGPLSAYTEARGPLANPSRSTRPRLQQLQRNKRSKLIFGKLPLGKMHIWEVVPWEVVTL